MGWYISKIVEFASVSGHQRGKCNISYTLIKAKDHHSAYAKTTLLLKPKKFKYKNVNGKYVIDERIGIADIIYIGKELKDGDELFLSSPSNVTRNHALRKIPKKGELSIYAKANSKADKTNDYVSLDAMKQLETLLTLKRSELRDKCKK
jgi:hypothetical protein